MKKQFDLKYYLEHPDIKVVTRDNRNVRIICTDRKDSLYPIIALIDGNAVEYAATRTIDGYKFAGCQESNEDLFFDLPEPTKKKVPLTYEDFLQRIKDGKTMWIESDYGLVLTTFIDDDGNLVYGDTGMTPQKLIDEELHFADGDPCWKEIVE